jgi:phosphatidylinositol alpha-1,6-mannosyltransferase
MPVGEALGISGGGSLTSARFEELRVLALVTDAFGGPGGIAQYNRDFFSSLANSDRVDEIIVLPRRAAAVLGNLPPRVRQLPPVQGRLAYSLAALGAAATHAPIHVVFCGHLFMAPLAAAVAKLVRARLWVQVHGTEAWQELSSLHRRSVEMAHLVTSVSRYTRARLLEWIGIDPARVKVLPNTVDQQFRPGPKPGYLMHRHDVHGKKVLMTVSRLAGSDRYKGHDQVIRTLPQVLLAHPQTIYLVVGDGDDRPRLESLAAQCGVGDQVRFAGHVSSEERPDYFRLADVFVMPSTGEGFGIVFLEAMASGIDVIGGNRDGSLDPLGDGRRGRAIDPDDAEELRQAICAALSKSQGRIDQANQSFGIQLFTEHLDALVQSNLLGSR